MHKARGKRYKRSVTMAHWVVMAHVFNARTWEAEETDLCEFKASLVYSASSRTGSKATEKPCLKKPKTNQPNGYYGSRSHNRLAAQPGQKVR